MTHLPLLVAQTGETDCSAAFVRSLMSWMDAHGGAGYGVWLFGTGECPSTNPSGGSALLANGSGAMTPFGQGVNSYFATASHGGASLSCAPGQFRATYYNHMTLSGSPVLTQCERAVGYHWGNGGPRGGVGNDHFSARWVTRAQFAAGAYTFTLTGDDSIRLYVDASLVINRWKDQSATPYTAKRTLTSGVPEVKVEYDENAYQAVAVASWQAG
jgi:hypothetical protein